MILNKRHWAFIRMLFISSSMKRAQYMKQKGFFRSMGTRVMIMDRKIPLYSELISIGNNVWIASGVHFVTHDVCHYMLNGLKDGRKYFEKLGCIEIGDNVFVGTGATILYDVKIGNNVVIAAGTYVNKDIPDNSVVGGVPAKVLGSFDDFKAKRAQVKNANQPVVAGGDLSDVCIEEVWDAFTALHS